MLYSNLNLIITIINNKKFICHKKPLILTKLVYNFTTSHQNSFTP